MNPRRLDLTGKRFGRLVVLKMDHINRHQQSMWKCRCDCGETIVTSGSTLKGGRSRSCGCFKADRARETAHRHGQSRTTEYRIWAYMLQRCTNPNNTKFHLWGGRGIKVCKRWRDFANFFADMGKRPSRKHSIDRYPDMNGNYEPTNCRWATAKQQSANSRRWA